MAVSGTVPARTRAGFDLQRLTKRLRRITACLGIAFGIFCVVRFGSMWVPARMDTVPTIPPGSWCLVDRWKGGMHVGSDVFVDVDAGRVLTRIAAIDQDTVTVLHPNGNSAWPDSRQFGLLPHAAVHSTVMVVFAGDGGTARGR